MTTLRANAMGALVAVAFLWLAIPDAPVADAAMRGDVDAVREMLRQGADVNAAQGDGMTALHWAAERGDLELLELLLYAGARPAAVTRNGAHTPLHLATRAGRARASGFLLERGADIGRRTSRGATALHFAVSSADLETVRTLLEHGAEVDAREGAYAQTPLMWAAANGFTEIARLLVERGADVGMTSRVEDIQARGKADREDLKRRNARMDALIALERQAEGTGGEPAVIARTIEEVQEEEEEAEEPEAEPLSYDDLVGRKGGLSPLMFAAREGHRETVMALLDLGADLNQVSEGDHSSALLLASINGHFDMGKELLELGADPDLASDAGATPLYAAINLQWHPKSIYPQPQAYKQQQQTYLDYMKALLEAGADPNARLTKTLWYMEFNFERLSVDFAGSTPFFRAAYAQDVDAMKLLVAYGADPQIPTRKMPERRFRGYDEEKEEDPSGVPPVPVGGPAAYPIHAATGIGFGEGYAGGFHRGVPNGWLPAVKYLVDELGADVNARDYNAYTPLHHAASRGDVDVIRFLVDRGADVTLVSRRGQSTADMANGAVQRVQPFPEALALLESLGATNNHNCVSC